MIDRLELYLIGEGLTVYGVGGGRFVVESVCDNLGLEVDGQLERIRFTLGIVAGVGYLPGSWVELVRLERSVVHTLSGREMVVWLGDARMGRGKGAQAQAVLRARLAAYRVFFEAECQAVANNSKKSAGRELVARVKKR